VNNIIPDWNDLVYSGRWREAIRQLHATNNFRSSRAHLRRRAKRLCAGISEPPVTIKHIEKTIVESRVGRGSSAPSPPEIKTGNASR